MPERRFLGLGSAIKIYNPNRTSRNIYATVIHEIAHASHWNMDRTGYNKSQDIVAESWARGVEWELTRMVYPDYEPFYGRRKENPNSNIVNYTGIVQDMIDGINENNSDRVSGYTIRQIEDALFRQNTWEGWRDNIIRIHNNPTERHLFVLFDYWN